MYIYWLLIFIGSPILILFLLDPKIISENPKIFKKTALGALIFGIPYDLIGTNLGIWFYPKHLVGLSLLGLPLEEFIFIFLSIFAVTYTTLFALKHFKS